MPQAHYRPLSARLQFGVWPAAWTGAGTLASLAGVGREVGLGVIDVNHAGGSLLMWTPLLAIITLVVARLLWGYATIEHLIRGRWLAFVFTLIAPAFCVLVVGGALFAAYEFEWSPRFWAARPHLEAMIAEAADQPSYKEFPWAVTGFGGEGNTEEIVVYDATDRLPAEIQAGRTKWRSDKTAVAGMGRHFYLVNEYLN